MIFSECCNPEQNLAEKEKFSCLSEEAKLVIDCITDIPDEFYKKNGTIKISKLRQWLSSKYHWDYLTINFAILELNFFVKYILRK